MRVWKRQKIVLLPPTNVASNARDKKDAPVDRRAPQSLELSITLLTLSRAGFFGAPAGRGGHKVPP